MLLDAGINPNRSTAPGILDPKSLQQRDPKQNLRAWPSSYTLVEHELHSHHRSLRTLFPCRMRHLACLSHWIYTIPRLARNPTHRIPAARGTTSHCSVRSRQTSCTSRADCLRPGQASGRRRQLQPQSDPARYCPADRHEDHRRSCRPTCLRQIRSGNSRRDSGHAAGWHRQQHDAARSSGPHSCRVDPVSAKWRSHAAQPQHLCFRRSVGIQQPGVQWTVRFSRPAQPDSPAAANLTIPERSSRAGSSSWRRTDLWAGRCQCHSSVGQYQSTIPQRCLDSPADLRTDAADAVATAVTSFPVTRIKFIVFCWIQRMPSLRLRGQRRDTQSMHPNRQIVSE